ncbi:MAG: hypothetical protein MUP30_00410 [Deltaproteobacteria bacterium]|nr:hypothetical protein [Deltaproteobacteria bacterium]
MKHGFQREIREATAAPRAAAKSGGARSGGNGTADTSCRMFVALSYGKASQLDRVVISGIIVRRKRVKKDAMRV